MAGRQLTMDINDLFLSCRRGDLSRVEYLSEQREVDLNVRDKWDSTPLYYACLCGHADLVGYLLERGAKCEANSFDGERCLYGALNNEIRNMLRTFKVVTSVTIRRDSFQEFMRRAMERGSFSDIEFTVHGERFRAHRCILAARSEQFRELLYKKWGNRNTINISHQLVEPSIFAAVLQYIYTGRVEASVDDLTELERLAKYCRLELLVEQLQIRRMNIVEFATTKPGVRVKTVCIEPIHQSTKLQDDLSDLVNRATPAGFYTQVQAQFPFTADCDQISPDLILRVEGYQFFCHKLFFCERSEYFKILVDDHFAEGHMVETDRWGPLPELTLHQVDAHIFMEVLSFVYTDSAEVTEENVYDMLPVADLYLLPGLKRQCGGVLGQQLTTENVVNILETARLFDLPRLESQCAEFIAANIEKVLEMEEFKILVQKDADSIQDRHEVDSIDIIDDVRYHVANRLQSVSDMYEAERKLALIDEFLESLNLVA